MNILVTGGNGQLGNEMRTLSTFSKNNYIFTDVTTPEGFMTEILDITDLEAVRGMSVNNKIDCIVNCAAYTNVEKAEDNYDLAFMLNAKAAENLAITAREIGAFLIHVSTDYVFHGDSCLPYSESSPTDPIGVYGKTKLAGEKAIGESRCKYIIFRTAWLYSPYGNNFVKTIRRLTSQKTSLSVVFDQVGTPTYAADLAAAIFYIIENEKMSGYEGVYHFSNEGVCSWYDFAVQIDRISGIKGCVIVPCHSDEFPSKVQRPNFSVLDKTKYKKTFGQSVPYWIDGLKRCIEILDTMND